MNRRKTKNKKEKRKKEKLLFLTYQKSNYLKFSLLYVKVGFLYIGCCYWEKLKNKFLVFPDGSNPFSSLSLPGGYYVWNRFILFGVDYFLLFVLHYPFRFWDNGKFLFHQKNK